MGKYWIPDDMKFAPELASGQATGPVREQHALLINPFYPQRSARQFWKTRADSFIATGSRSTGALCWDLITTAKTCSRKQ